MPTETAAPVVETPVEKPTPPPVIAKTVEAPKSEGRKFPKFRSLTETVKAQQEPEKPKPVAKEPVKATETAKEAPKAVGDTQTTPKVETASLRATLAQGEAPAETTKVANIEEADDDAEEANDPTLTDKMRKRINKANAKVAKESEARTAAEKKAADLEKRVAELDAKPKITEAQQKEQQAKEEELTRLRRRYSLETDPEVKKFDTRIEAARKTVDATVEKASGIPDFVRAMIKDAGGLETFLRSGKTYDIKVEGENQKLTGSQIYKHLLPNLDPIDVGTIQTSIGEQNRLQTEKASFVEAEVGKAKEWQDTQTKQFEDARKQQENAVSQQSAMFTTIAERVGKEKFMQDEDVPATGDEDEIKAVKSRNTLRKGLRQLVVETINFKPTSDNPEQARKQIEDYYTEVIRDSAKLYYAEHELKLATAKIKKLESDLDAIKGASRTTPRNSNGAAAPASTIATKVPAREKGESNFSYGMRLIQAGIPEADRQAALRKA